MARLSDHDQRDAEHVLRSEITLMLSRYARRMAEKGKAYITEAIAQSAKDGGNTDGVTVGKIAAERVKSEYFITKPNPAIEISAAGQLEAGSAAGDKSVEPRAARTSRKR